MQGLHTAFHSPEHYQGGQYRLLPFKFLTLDSARCFVSNLAGDYLVLEKQTLRDLIAGKISPDHSLYDDLKSGHFIYDGDSSVHLDLLATKYRTRQARLPEFTSLHIFVVTLRCDHTCQYCQVSRVSEDRERFDMSVETARKAIDAVFQSPCKAPKIEFQGGEPLLNFLLIQFIVKEVNRRNNGRNFQFVITTNLSKITDGILDYCAQNQIKISTSLDGPRELHNANRPRPNGDSYERAVAGIRRARTVLGDNAVSALMTTTRKGLSQPETIIDEYVKLGFRSIFLRHLSPYGFAARGAGKDYGTQEFLSFYKRGLAHIIQLNRAGMPFVEVYTQLILQKMHTPFATGYVDLQSPSGLGTAVLAYNYNGDVYPSDEARMLAEMGDRRFRLGNLHSNSYKEFILNSELLPIVSETMTEGLPGCSDCALQPYCGSDPVFHYRTQGDHIGHRPTSAFCKRNMEVMRHLVLLMEDSPSDATILRSWIL